MTESRRPRRRASSREEAPSSRERPARARGGERAASARRGREERPSRGRGRGEFQYRRRDPSVIDKRSRQSSFDGETFIDENVKTFSPKEGTTFLRILPPTWEGAEHYAYDIYVHYSVGPNSSSFLCPFNMAKEPCPVCEEKQRALEDNDEEYAQQLTATRRTLMYVVDRDQPKDLLAWAAPWTIDRDISKISKDKRTNEFLYVDDPDEGYDIVLDREGTGMRTQYTVSIDRKDSPLDDDEKLAYIAEHPLPEVLQHHDYDTMLAALQGGASPRRHEKQDNQERRPARSRGDEREEEEEQAGDLTPAKIRAMDENELQACIDDNRLAITDEEVDELLDDGKIDELAEVVINELGLEDERPARRPRNR